MDALNRAERERYATLLDELRSVLQEKRELPDGFAFRFPAEPVLFLKLADWVTLESRCCPFLRFQLSLEQEAGPAWLRLTGREGVKDFLKNEFQMIEA